MLSRLAWSWLRAMPAQQAGALVAAGLVLAVVFHRFMLRRLARRNMVRIGNYADKGCLFAFQAWRSYFMILVMIAMGSFLRHTAIPRVYLALLYTAMGGALILPAWAISPIYGAVEPWTATILTHRQSVDFPP